jgi:MoaA/NifB/PqqE/SkfB family radical SAM enzyme
MITFALDQSCNLSCPSCRNQIISEKYSQSTIKVRAVEEKLVPLLPKLKTLHINPAGELFSSKSSRRLLELINNESCPDLQIDIISNGTLFSQEEWNKFPGIHGKVRTVRISTDAARRETFEKLRRLGNYDKFCENIIFLRDLRNENIIPQLGFSFTYQLDNFREMPEFLQFSKSMSGDIVIFERLQNITFSADEYKMKAVHLIDHPLYSDFREIVNQQQFCAHWIWHDFENGDTKH